MKAIGPTPSEIRDKLAQRWEKGFFLKDYKRLFPYSFPLGTITSKQITDSYEQVQKWIQILQGDQKIAPFIQWEEINHRYFGRNKIPKRLLFETAEALALFLHRLDQWKQFENSLLKLKQTNEQLLIWGEEHPLEVLRISSELERLITLYRWMCDHPRPFIYLRQIDLPDIDTKFTEKHLKTLSSWLTRTPHLENRDHSSTRFEDVFGYRTKPELIRFRFLDPSIRWFGCDDISIPADQFCKLYYDKNSLPIERVFVVENDISALSFPQVANSMVVFGRGYHFDQFRDCRWFSDVELYYWGDLDTHGFSILNEFRSIFGHARSILMDEATLQEHKISWGFEPKPTKINLPHLKEEESLLYDALRYNRIQSNLRLEQEFIRYGRVKEAIALLFC
jgi:hypothetical protein